MCILQKAVRLSMTILAKAHKDGQCIKLQQYSDVVGTFYFSAP